MKELIKILVIHSQLVVAIEFKILIRKNFDISYLSKIDINKILKADPQVIILEYNPSLKQKYTPDYLLDILNIPILLITGSDNNTQLKYNYNIIYEPFTRESLTKEILEVLKRFNREEVINGKYI